MGGSTTISTSATRIDALKLQSSAYGVTIPLVYGVARVPVNLLWYNGFKAIPHTTTQGGGKGGGVKSQNTTFTYTANAILAVCHGQITGVPRIWRGKMMHVGGVTGSQLLTTSQLYTPPSVGSSVTVTNAATFTAAAGVSGAPYGFTQYLSPGSDYTFVSGVFTLLNAAYAGVQLTLRYQYTTGGISQTALQELGLSFKSGAIGQAVWSFLNTTYPSEALSYSGLAILTGQDYDLGDGAQVENHTIEVQGPLAYSLGSTIPDVDPAAVLIDTLLNSRYGAGFPATALDGLQSWSDYCVAAGLLISPAMTTQVKAAEIVTRIAELTNTAPVTSGGRLKMLPYGDSAESGNGRTYTPNTTPVYDLDDSCFIPDEGEPPVEVSLKTGAELYNHVRIEFLNRANQYNPETAEAKDQADIDANGLRSKDIVEAHWIADAAVARKVAQLVLQRSLYVPAEYRFRLPPNYNLLEPMDLVTLTEPGLGLSLLPVRVIAADEEGDGDMSVTAEDYPAGVASAALYASQVGAGFAHDYNADPGNVSTPVIFEGPGELTPGTGLEVYVAARGTGANWGGCRVWVSSDGTNYREVGRINGGSRYGALTGPISAGNLPVSVVGGQLLSGSAADAAALATLCYIGGTTPEWLAYQTATLTGTNAYTLSGLNRGAYSTVGTNAHATTDPFVRVDDAIAKSGPLDSSLIGSTLSFKFTSYNVYGGNEQSLAAVSAYTYTLTGRFSPNGRAVLFQAVSKGAADTALVSLPGCARLTPYVRHTGAARSYSLAKFDRATGALLLARAYDVYGVGAVGGYTAATLAADLNACTTAHIVAVTTYDEPKLNRLTSGLEAAMYRCGASKGVFGSPQFKAQSAYVLVGIGGCGEGNGFEAYSGSVDSDTNAWCDVAFEITLGQLIVTGSRATPRTLADYSYTGDLNATTDLALVATSGADLAGNTAVKTGATSAWDASVYSRDGYTGGAYASGVVMATNKNVVFGLSANPTGSVSHTGIDYGINPSSAGGLYADELGSTTLINATYAVGDVLAVLYDGVTVKWTQNGNVRRTLAVAAGLKLYFDSSLFHTGAQIGGVRFGPMGGRATDPLSAYTATQTYSFGVPSDPGVRVRIAPQTLSYVNDSGIALPIEITASCSQKLTLDAGAASPVDAYTNLAYSLDGGSSYTYLGAFPTTPAVAPGSSYSFNGAFVASVVLPIGATLYVQLFTSYSYFSANVGHGSLRTDDALIRIAAIKR